MQRQTQCLTQRTTSSGVKNIEEIQNLTLGSCGCGFLKADTLIYLGTEAKMEIITKDRRIVIIKEEKPLNDPGFTTEKILEEIRYRIDEGISEDRMVERVEIIFR